MVVCKSGLLPKTLVNTKTLLVGKCFGKFCLPFAPLRLLNPTCIDLIPEF